MLARGKHTGGDSGHLHASVLRVTPARTLELVNEVLALARFDEAVANGHDGIEVFLFLHAGVQEHAVLEGYLHVRRLAELERAVPRAAHVMHVIVDDAAEHDADAVFGENAVSVIWLRSAMERVTFVHETLRSPSKVGIEDRSVGGLAGGRCQRQSQAEKDGGCGGCDHPVGWRRMV